MINRLLCGYCVSNCLSESLYLAPVIHVAPLPRRLPVLRLHSLQQRPHVLPAHRQSISQPVFHTKQSIRHQLFMVQSISKPVFYKAIHNSTSVLCYINLLVKQCSREQTINQPVFNKVIYKSTSVSLGSL